MFQAVHISNPFSPYEGLYREMQEAGGTIREWLKKQFGPDWTEFPVATICQHNGEVVLRRDWDTRELKDGDVLAFVAVPQEPVTIVLAIIAVVVAVAAVLLMPDPKIPADSTQSPNSAYTLRGQTNRFRPNEPVEVVYGRCRVWPTLITRPYSRYIGNLQYQYSLFCLGQGEVDIEQLRLDDTNLEDFDEVEYEVIPPGGTCDLVESAVYQALEVSNIELLGPNHEDYVGPSGPFVLNDFDKKIKRIEVDISFPQGLYFMGSEGKIKDISIALKFRAREIDADGDPIGDWFWLWGNGSDELVITRQDNTPQRVTFSQAVPLGRYEIEGRRVTNMHDGTQAITQTRWESAKGYAKNLGNFGDVTLIGLKVVATNQLNDNVSRSFNATLTRKLETWSPGGGWTARVATRNPIWAFVDVFRAEYGAKLSDEYIDLANLYDLAQFYETNSIWFDWVFDEGITPWEAAKTILRVGRAVPIPRGSLVTAIRDVPQTLPSAVFNQHNIVEGTLTKKLAMFDFQPFDALIIEYTDANTWKTREVTCTLPGRAGTNPDRLKLPGCTNRNRAYREGMHILTRREYQRKSVTFHTGLEGHIPDYMDLVAVTHDTVRVGQGGMVLAYNSATNEMTLSQQVDFGSVNLTHKILLRGPDGAAMSNPIAVTPGSAPNKVILASDPPEALDFSENVAPPLYAFGVQDIHAFLGKLVGIRPVNSTTVELTLLNYVDASYAHDETVVTDVDQIESINDSSNPSVAWVTISGVPGTATRVYVDFPPVPGARSYILQVSYDDGDNWTAAGTYPSPPVSLGANLGTMKVRVAPFAVGGSILYTTSNEYIVGSILNTPESPEMVDPQPVWDSLTAKVKWVATTGANGYIANLYIPGVPTFLREIAVGSALQVEYTRAQFEADSPSLNSRDIEFRVVAYNDGGSSAETVETLSNPVPDAPTALTAGAPTGSVYPVSWTHPTPADLKEFKVYASTTPGFTPGPGNLVYTGLTPSTTITASVTTYWRVSAGDVWGPEEAMSAEATIP